MAHDASELSVSVPEAARRLGLSPRSVATLAARGEIESRKVGRKRIIPVVALEEFIKGALSAEDASKQR